MDKVISIKIHSQDFDVKVSDEFVIFLVSSMSEDLDLNANNSRLQLLTAYCRTVAKIYENDLAIKKLSDSIIL